MPDGIRSPSLIVTCEHACPEVPAGFGGVIPAGLLRTHRAYDAGALELAVAVAAAFGAPLFVNTVTRLMVDLNRSESNPAIWSRYALELPELKRRELLERVYRPFRQDVSGQVAEGLRSGPVVHLSVHSFTPVLRGERRSTDIGLLFDPARRSELVFCRAWQRNLRAARPRWRVHLNRPYRGVDDGHTTELRGRFGAAGAGGKPRDFSKDFAVRGYLGIELEINQRLVRGRCVSSGRGRGRADAAASRVMELHRAVVESLGRTIDGLARPSGGRVGTSAGRA